MALERHVALLGPMGAGKSVVLPRVAAGLEVPAVDLDTQIEVTSGLSIRAIFDRLGEAAFRTLEARVLQRVLSDAPAVIATGGGAVAGEAAWGLFRDRGAITVHLDAPAVTLARRTGPGARPLLEGLDAAGRERRLERLCSERAPYYRRADLRVDTSQADVEAVARAVVTGVRRHAERSVAVRLPGAGYQVVIEDGGAETVAAWVARRLPPDGPRRRLGVVGDEVVLDLHGGVLCAALREAGYEVAVVEVPSGEAAKTWRGLERVLDRLVEAGLQRGSIVLGFGGGSTTDVAGLAAALFKRGVPVVQVPTTLLAMVDAAVGGKTAINHGHGKNLIGAFHQPALVVAPLGVLQTLPEEELRAAMGEVLKMALLEGEAGLAWAESLPRPRPWEGKALARLLLRSVRGKARVVEQDAEETKGARVCLNLGHTLGHALEHAGGLRHGEAVGLGLVAACRVAVALGHCPPRYEDRVRSVLKAWCLPVDLMPRLSEAVWHRLSGDKKARGGAIEWVLPTPGGVEVVSLTSAQVRGILGTP